MIRKKILIALTHDYIFNSKNQVIYDDSQTDSLFPLSFRRPLHLVSLHNAHLFRQDVLESVLRSYYNQALITLFLPRCIRTCLPTSQTMLLMQHIILTCWRRSTNSAKENMAEHPHIEEDEARTPGAGTGTAKITLLINR